MVKFFTPDEEAKIVAAIQAAERRSSGEIRVHLEDNPRLPTFDEAVRVFRKLGMHQTRDRNGVLILLAPERREFAILGDEGINARVGDDFWRAERDLLQTHFRQNQFALGIALAIGQIGEKLREYFPYEDDDENELSDTISYG